MKTVFVNGTFDILHPGHIALLNTARSAGDFLIVAIDSDRRVQELKGNTRPVNNEQVRQIMLSNIKAVDIVEIFDTNTELEALLKMYEPDIMFKGSDWKDKDIVGEHLVGHIEYFDRINEYSTTKTIQSITDR